MGTDLLYIHRYLIVRVNTKYSGRLKLRLNCKYGNIVIPMQVLLSESESMYPGLKHSQ